MKDQYDDGRYDGAPDPDRVARSSLYPDEYSLRQYHLTAADLPAFTVERGGIKYPTPTKLKGTTMAQSVTQKLAALREQQLGLARQIAALEKAIKRPAPPAEQNAWTVDVRFNRDGKLYNYLILRVNGMYYTTGTNVQDSHFRTWADLLEWLDSAAGHTAMIPLRAAYEQDAPLEGRRD